MPAMTDEDAMTKALSEWMVANKIWSRDAREGFCAGWRAAMAHYDGHQGLTENEYASIEARRSQERVRIWDLVVSSATGNGPAPVVEEAT